MLGNHKKTEPIGMTLLRVPYASDDPFVAASDVLVIEPHAKTQPPLVDPHQRLSRKSLDSSLVRERTPFSIGFGGAQGMQAEESFPSMHGRRSLDAGSRGQLRASTTRDLHSVGAGLPRQHGLMPDFSVARAQSDQGLLEVMSSLRHSSVSVGRPASRPGSSRALLQNHGRPAHQTRVSKREQLIVGSRAKSEINLHRHSLDVASSPRQHRSQMPHAFSSSHVGDTQVMSSRGGQDDRRKSMDSGMSPQARRDDRRRSMDHAIKSGRSGHDDRRKSMDNAVRSSAGSGVHLAWGSHGKLGAASGSSMVLGARPPSQGHLHHAVRASFSDAPARVSFAEAPPRASYE